MEPGSSRFHKFKANKRKGCRPQTKRIGTEVAPTRKQNREKPTPSANTQRITQQTLRTRFIRCLQNKSFISLK